MPSGAGSRVDRGPSTWLTIADLAHDTRLSERGVRQLIAEGRLPAYRVGRAIRIRRVDADALFTPHPAGGNE
jgi:excisionase family DNA binding protein